MKDSEFVLDYVSLLYYKCYEICSNCGGSYINSPDWIKNKNVKISLINKKDNKYVQYSVTVVLKYEEIKKDPQRITKIKLFTNKYIWEGIDFPSEKDDCETFEKNNNVTIALNVLYANKEKIYPAYVSKYNSNREKQVTVLMISNGKKQWHCLAAKIYQHF